MKARRTNTPPFDFVLDQLAPCAPIVKPMFGCHAVYVGEKLVLVLRKRHDHAYDNGVWLATTHEHHKSLKAIFPSMRSIRLFGTPTSAWQNLPAGANDFETLVELACSMVLKNDPRIGRTSGAMGKKVIRRR